MSLNTIHIDKIVLSRRRTIALVVTRDATLVVRAPYHTSLAYIERLVTRKSQWIWRKIAEVRIRRKQFMEELVNRGDLLYLGKRYQLQVVGDVHEPLEFDGTFALSDRALPHAHAVLEQWYKAQAVKIIGERCTMYATRIGCRPTSVRITSAQRRWGSCGVKGTLNFAWRLIMAPLEVIDYVIVHELVHIGQMDHSRLFWNKVSRILPGYEGQKQWLKEHDHYLKL